VGYTAKFEEESIVMAKQRLPASSLIDWISDDLSYLRALPEESKGKGAGFYNNSRQAHDTRLLIVFGHAMIEGYTKYVAQETGSGVKLSATDLIEELGYPTEALTVGSLDKLAVLLNGIKSLRNVIAHGITSVGNKVESIQLANLPVDPTTLNEQHYDIILEGVENVINILGMGLAIHNSEKRETSN
jgi:hypothetical protein